MINHVLEKGLWAMGFSGERKKKKKLIQTLLRRVFG
jgi:hypothetical protein